MLIDYNYSILHSNLIPQALPCLDLPSGNVLRVPHFFEFKIWHYQIMLLCPAYNVTKSQNRKC